MKAAPFAAVVNAHAHSARTAVKAARSVLTAPAVLTRPSVRTALRGQRRQTGRSVLTGPLVPIRPTGRIVRIGLDRTALTVPGVLTTAA